MTALNRHVNIDRRPYHENAQEVGFAAEDLCDLWKAVRVAQEVGGSLGRGSLLLRTVSPYKISHKSLKSCKSPLGLRCLSETFPLIPS
jgi:hypothetical protein